MPLNSPERKAVLKELSKKYRSATKKDKVNILNQLVDLTGYNRSYAARALRRITRPDRGRILSPRPKGGGRKQVYDGEVIQALKKVWAVLDFPSGKRLAPYLPEIVPVLERVGELRLTEDVRDKLSSISSSTIDRLLTPERKKLALKGRSGTKPGSLLKRDIPIKTFADWNDSEPGFLEIDLVAHDGGNPRGDYAQTLDVVDVATGWTETVAIKNKAQKWVFEALKQVIARLPFSVKGIDSDNGAEFINSHLIRFCNQAQITFTRARPYRKNDSCYVEQKNWSVVRKTVGYLRYDTEEELDTLNHLYELLRLFTNYFQPVMKLASKQRNGSRVIKRHDQAKTPYQRSLLSPNLTDKAKSRLREEYATLNPVSLKRRINDLQQKLIKLSTLKKSTPCKDYDKTSQVHLFLMQ